MFWVIPVVLYRPTKEINAFTFLDQGYFKTLIDEKLTCEVGTEGAVEPMYLKWSNDVTRLECNSGRIALEISGDGGNCKGAITLVK